MDVIRYESHKFAIEGNITNKSFKFGVDINKEVNISEQQSTIISRRGQVSKTFQGKLNTDAKKQKKSVFSDKSKFAINVGVSKTCGQIGVKTPKFDFGLKVDENGGGVNLRNNDKCIDFNADKTGICVNAQDNETTFGLQAGKLGLGMGVKSGETIIGINAG